MMFEMDKPSITKLLAPARHVFGNDVRVNVYPHLGQI